MALSHIFGFLVHPGKGERDTPDPKGTTVPLAGGLFNMLNGVFALSERECNTEIAFKPTDGVQENQRRTEVIDFLTKPSLQTGAVLAHRLQEATTHRSGLGLLFLLFGSESGEKKVVISRFPAEHGILADEQQSGLRVEYLEKVFMRSEKAYKAALYKGFSTDTDFWDGHAVDRQINALAKSISDYWIYDFLVSDFRTTSAQGTMRIAKALKAVIKGTDSLSNKEAVIAATKLAPGLDGKSISVKSFVKQFGLSDEIYAALQKEIKNPNILNDRFRFSSAEFTIHLPFQSVELDNGAMLTAPVENFDDCFAKEQVADSNEVLYTTRGKVIDEALRSRR